MQMCSLHATAYRVVMKTPLKRTAMCSLGKCLNPRALRTRNRRERDTLRTRRYALTCVSAISHQLRHAWAGEICADLGCEEGACFFCKTHCLGIFHSSLRHLRITIHSGKTVCVRLGRPPAESCEISGYWANNLANLVQRGLMVP